MKAKHAAAYALEANATLALLKIKPGQKFHSLRTAQIEALSLQADAVKYQKPKNAADGSRARCFFDLLQRRAQQK